MKDVKKSHKLKYRRGALHNERIARTFYYNIVPATIMRSDNQRRACIVLNMYVKTGGKKKNSRITDYMDCVFRIFIRI